VYDEYKIRHTVGSALDRIMGPGLVSKWTSASHPLMVVGVGVLFAVSFDTLSQAVLFGTMAVQFGAGYSVVLFAFAFILGMLLVDGANAVWVTSMLQRSESGARIVSRILGVSIAVLSLSVAGLKILSYCLSDA